MQIPRKCDVKTVESNFWHPPSHLKVLDSSTSLLHCQSRVFAAKLKPNQILCFRKQDIQEVNRPVFFTFWEKLQLKPRTYRNSSLKISIIDDFPKKITCIGKNMIILVKFVIRVTRKIFSSKIYYLDNSTYSKQQTIFHFPSQQGLGTLRTPMVPLMKARFLKLLIGYLLCTLCTKHVSSFVTYFA